MIMTVLRTCIRFRIHSPCNRENQPSTDWDGFVKGLRAIGFDGVLNFETAPVLDSFPAELRGQALAFIGEIGAYFASFLQ